MYSDKALSSARRDGIVLEKANKNDSRIVLNDISVEFLKVFWPAEYTRRLNVENKVYHRAEDKKNDLSIIPSVSSTVRQALIFTEIPEYVPEEAALYTTVESLTDEIVIKWIKAKLLKSGEARDDRDLSQLNMFALQLSREYKLTGSKSSVKDQITTHVAALLEGIQEMNIHLTDHEKIALFIRSFYDKFLIYKVLITILNPPYPLQGTYGTNLAAVELPYRTATKLYWLGNDFRCFTSEVTHVIITTTQPILNMYSGAIDIFDILEQSTRNIHFSIPQTNKEILGDFFTKCIMEKFEYLQSKTVKTLTDGTKGKKFSQIQVNRVSMDGGWSDTDDIAVETYEEDEEKEAEDVEPPVFKKMRMEEHTTNRPRQSDFVRKCFNCWSPTCRLSECTQLCRACKKKPAKDCMDNKCHEERKRLLNEARANDAKTTGVKKVSFESEEMESEEADTTFNYGLKFFRISCDDTPGISESNKKNLRKLKIRIGTQDVIDNCDIQDIERKNIKGNNTDIAAIADSGADTLLASPEMIKALQEKDARIEIKKLSRPILAVLADESKKIIRNYATVPRMIIILPSLKELKVENVDILICEGVKEFIIGNSLLRDVFNIDMINILESLNSDFVYSMRKVEIRDEDGSILNRQIRDKVFVPATY